jgi:hypothetical protein
MSIACADSFTPRAESFTPRVEPSTPRAEPSTPRAKNPFWMIDHENILQSAPPAVFITADIHVEKSSGSDWMPAHGEGACYEVQLMCAEEPAEDSMIDTKYCMVDIVPLNVPQAPQPYPDPQNLSEAELEQLQDIMTHFSEEVLAELPQIRHQILSPYEHLFWVDDQLFLVRIYRNDA